MDLGCQISGGEIVSLGYIFNSTFRTERFLEISAKVVLGFLFYFLFCFPEDGIWSRD